jgi:hypothetical protein
MKFAPPADPRQITPAFSYAMQFLQYGWVNSIDGEGHQCKSLASPRIVNSLGHLGHFSGDVPLYQVHELPVLE